MVCKTKITAMILMLALALGWGGSTLAQVTAPPNAMPAVMSLGDRILALAKDPSCKADREGCREKLRVLIEQYWDTTDMARSALGYHWKSLDTQQQQQFTKLFSDLIESIYLSRSNFSKAEGYTDTVTIAYLKEIPEGEDYSKISTTVTLKPGEKPIHVDYRTHWEDGKWMVYDIIVEDISLTGNYRNQFNRVINNQGYPELVRLLQDKLQQLKAS